MSKVCVQAGVCLLGGYLLGEYLLGGAKIQAHLCQQTCQCSTNKDFQVQLVEKVILVEIVSLVNPMKIAITVKPGESS